MTWEQIRERLSQLIDELPWYRRWSAKAALWALERDFNPKVLSALMVVLAMLAGILLAIILAFCR